MANQDRPRPLRVGVQMDPIERINITGDSTFGLMLEAQARGHHLFYYTPERLTQRDGRITAVMQEVRVQDVKGDHVAFGDSARKDLADDLDVILLRQDPPFDLAYITTTHMLERIHPRTLVVTISQSGETADTIAALKHARSLGMKHTLTICNVATSAMVRECELAYITRAGAEIGVASTKAFTTQLGGLFLLTLTLAKLRGHLTAEQESQWMRDLRHLPAALQSVLALEPQIIAWSEDFAKKQDALFLGRGLHYPIALEGALKLKEITYIHAEAYAAGELKHGPLALVDANMPVVTVAPNDALVDKLKSNMQEVRARGGELYVFADADSQIASEAGIHVIRMPEHYGALSPILHVVPLQLLAYHTACARGTDVDKPRNLAKSVTVE